MRDMLDRLGRDFDADVGFIAVDASGNPVAMHRTRDMPHAFFAGEASVTSRMRVP
jgi:beta-aspartyl-peptidase (threonine type)